MRMELSLASHRLGQMARHHGRRIWQMSQVITPIRCIILLILSSCLTEFDARADEQSLPRSTPESQGVDSRAIRRFLDEADQVCDTVHSFMLVRHGQVISEAWWAPENAAKPHVLYSLSKSFTSTAVGLAIQDGKIKLSDKVISFFPDESPVSPNDHLAAMTIRDLLTMSAGHITNAPLTANESWERAFLKHPVPYQPGTRFYYNTPATYMCSAIVRKVTGQDILDYLNTRLFQPLGIPKPTWERNPAGVSVGGWGLSLRTEDIAKFGQLYLQKGVWKGQQIIPRDWIELATSRQVENGVKPDSDWAQGYGFQFWRCRHGAYRGDGAFGQFCVVIPEKQTVVIMTANNQDLQRQLNLVWTHLLPVLGEQSLPEDLDSLSQLRQREKSLRIKPNHRPKTLTLPRTISPESIVLTDLTLSSTILGQQMNYSLYLPPGKNTAASYPVLYLLHGFGDNHEGWIKNGQLQRAADNAIAKKILQPTVILMPDAKATYYLNNQFGTYQFEDYFFKEFMPILEKRYCKDVSKDRRSIAGLSMGGFGALLYAMRRPDLFQTCYAMSAGIRTDAEVEAMESEAFRKRYVSALGADVMKRPRVSEFWRQNSVLHLAKTTDPSNLSTVRFFIDCGDDDFLYQGNAALHHILRQAKIPHEYRVRDGGHTWDYWREALPMAFSFIEAGCQEAMQSRK